MARLAGVIRSHICDMCPDIRRLLVGQRWIIDLPTADSVGHISEKDTVYLPPKENPYDSRSTNPQEASGDIIKQDGDVYTTGYHSRRLIISDPAAATDDAINALSGTVGHIDCMASITATRLIQIIEAVLAKDGPQQVLRQITVFDVSKLDLPSFQGLLDTLSRTSISSIRLRLNSQSTSNLGPLDAMQALSDRRAELWNLEDLTIPVDFDAARSPMRPADAFARAGAFGMSLRLLTIMTTTPPNLIANLSTFCRIAEFAGHHCDVHFASSGRNPNAGRMDAEVAVQVFQE